MLAAAAEPKLNSDDLGFVNGAAKGGTTEVALGRLADEKSPIRACRLSPTVRFAIIRKSIAN